MSTTTEVVKTGAAKSWKTTIGGIGVAIGLVAESLNTHGWPEDAMGWMGLLFKAFGPIILGLFARDVNVSSEGKKVTPTLESPVS